MKVPQTRRAISSKTPTGIAGFDEITGGGLPRGRTTMLLGAPGAGKTLFGLQFLMHGALHAGEPGIFVAFEERSSRVLANAASFGWKLSRLGHKLVFIDAQPAPDLVLAGTFDLLGMLAALGAKAKATGARRIVLDALDVVLSLLPDQEARRREVYRLHAWLLDRGLTALITAKSSVDEDGASDCFSFMQFMVDCTVALNHRVLVGVSHRSLRVQKFRGSAFDENESPFLIGADGFEIAVARPLGGVARNVTQERVSSGIKRLDTMLGGGYYRGASILITGFPGTAKTTLAGAFAQAACLRGERTLFVSFDADSSEVVRDLGSVGIRLGTHVKGGKLRMVSARTVSGSSETTYLVRIKALAREHKSRCVVIDPVSTFSKSGSGLSAHSVAEKLVDWAKAEGITLLCTSVIDEMVSGAESNSSLQISMLADTWIHLSYLVQAGERNRGLSIIKSRGTAHSNQVRELVLSDAGVTLSDAYTAGGEVPMGTLRWEKERAARAAQEVTEVAGKLKGVRLDAEEAEIGVRVKALQVELEAKQAEKLLLVQTTNSRAGERSRGLSQIEELRGSDAATRGRKRKE